MGSAGFEPAKTKSTDLQSAPFDRSGNSPIFKSQLSESNRRPRDYKSRALPAELSWPLFTYSIVWHFWKKVK